MHFRKCNLFKISLSGIPISGLQPDLKKLGPFSGTPSQILGLQPRQNSAPNPSSDQQSLSDHVSLLYSRPLEVWDPSALFKSRANTTVSWLLGLV